jgi:hypothetical protein
MMIEIPQEVWDDLNYEIAREGLDYVDNFRAYRYHDGYGLAEFNKSRDNGCCGFFQSHTKVDGEKWIIGCNYGH